MPQQTLKDKALSSMVWTMFSKYSNMLITFVSGIILARMLSPYDYGCIGMLAIFMALAEIIIDGGFASALIQKKNPTQEDYSTIFFWNLSMAAILYVVLYFLAPAISRFYDIELLCPVLRVQGLILFIYAFNIIQRNQLKKKLNFKVLGIVSVTTSLISLVVTIWLAYHGYGVWSLVANNIISALIPAVVFWFYLKWRPIWTFSWESFKELFSFGGYMFLTHLVNTFCSKLTGLLIGKVYSPATLGYYSKAMSTESMASHAISTSIDSVTFPLYARVKDDKPAMAAMVKRLTSTIAYITFPVMFVLMLTAKPLFVLLYSEKWLASVPYFQVLCIAGAASCLQSVNLQTIAAIGKSKVMFYWTVIRRSVGLVFIIGGMLAFGMKGLLVGMVLYHWTYYFINMGLVSKYIGYKWNKQLLDLIPMAVMSVVAAVISYFAISPWHLNMYVDGILKVVVYAIIYMGWSLLFKPESFTYSLTIVPEKFRFWERKKKLV